MDSYDGQPAHWARYRELLERLYVSDPTLTCLDLDSADFLVFIHENANEFQDCMARNNSVEEVGVNAFRPHYAGAESGSVSDHYGFCVFLSKCVASLRSLRRMRIHGDDLLVASMYLASARQITSLRGRFVSSGDTLLGKDAMEVGLREHPNLESLSVLSFTWGVFQPFLATLSTMRKLNSVDFAVLGLKPDRLFNEEDLRVVLEQTPSLEEITLQRFLLDAPDDVLLAHALERYPKLKVLRLVDCQATDSNSLVLCRALGTNTRLIELQLTCQSDRRFYDNLASALSVNKTLQKLQLVCSGDCSSVDSDGLTTLTHSLARNTGLRSLVLCRFAWDDVAADAVHDYLSNTTSLERFRLYSPGKLTDSIWCRIYPALSNNGSLTALEVYGNLSPMLCGDTAAALCDNTTLRELAIVNDGDTRGADTLIQCLSNLRRNRSIKSLRIGRRSPTVTLEESQVVYNSIKTNYSLQECPVTIFADDTKDEASRVETGISTVLKMNQMGRNYLLNDKASKELGVALLSKLADHLDCVTMHILENPTLCERW